MRNDLLRHLQSGLVLPALPLALDEHKSIDERYQRALLRYYIAAGAGGVAAAVHTTQFEIRDPGIELFQPLLTFVRDVLHEELSARREPFLKIAGVCGGRTQAIAEAEYAASLGYDLVLLSLGALKDAMNDELIAHCRTIGEIIPLMGFYLQPAVGGRILPYEFWRRFFEIEQVVAVKIAPFNRYQTIDVVRALAASGRHDEVALYTGNDDNIIADLVTPFRVGSGGTEKEMRIRGGLLGQWSVWTRTAADLLSGIREQIDGKSLDYTDLLRKNIQLTDANGALFDVKNNFKGSIAGIHEVLHRQGLMRYTHCLSGKEVLSPGQAEEIDRVIAAYSWLRDDDFVGEHLDDWLR
jgi:dihydrodipicolinate synthase/N-acetylneuraminate lyase